MTNLKENCRPCNQFKYACLYKYLNIVLQTIFIFEMSKVSLDTYFSYYTYFLYIYFIYILYVFLILYVSSYLKLCIFHKFLQCYLLFLNIKYVHQSSSSF